MPNGAERYLTGDGTYVAGLAQRAVHAFRFRSVEDAHVFRRRWPGSRAVRITTWREPAYKALCALLPNAIEEGNSIRRQVWFQEVCWLWANVAPETEESVYTRMHAIEAARTLGGDDAVRVLVRLAPRGAPVREGRS